MSRSRVDSFSIDEAERWGDELEVLLKDSGIGVAPGSELERICLAPVEVLSYETGQSSTSAETYRQFLDTSSLVEIATRLIAARDHPSFPNLRPHLDLLNQGDPGQAGRGRPTDQASRKLFELLAALIAIDFAEVVELEDPQIGSDDNPDVALVYAGKRWGLACKVPTSDHPESLTQNVETAAKQVVASGVDAGFPFFNLRNVVPVYWRADPDDPEGARFVVLPEPDALQEQAVADTAELWRRVEDHAGAATLAGLLSPRPCVPIVLSYLHAMAPVQHETRQAATTCRFVSAYTIGSHEEDDEILAHALHTAASTGWAARGARRLQLRERRLDLAPSERPGNDVRS